MLSLTAVNNKLLTLNLNCECVQTGRIMTKKSATKSAAKPKAKKKTSSDSKKAATKTASKTAAKTTAKKQSASDTRSKSSSTKKPGNAPKNPSSTTNAKKAKSNGNGTDKRVVLIQQMAYFIAEERGFEGGDPVQDWLAAERKVDKMLKEKRT